MAFIENILSKLWLNNENNLKVEIIFVNFVLKGNQWEVSQNRQFKYN